MTMTMPIPSAPISPLRQRLIDDMNMRRFSRETQRNYIRDVGRLAAFLGRSPDTATAEDIRRFQVDQRDSGVPVPTMNSIVSALRFFFTQTIDRPDLARKLVRIFHPRKLPEVLSRDEVARLLNATTCLKHQAALSVAYGAGLRVAEVSALKVRDIDSERMLLRVERGKGGQYRNAMLPVDLLTLLRQLWTVGRQQGVMHREGWLFPGQHAMKPISTRQLHRVVVEAAQAADIAKRVGPLRYATALPPICWKTVSISVSSRSCWATASWRTPPSIPRWQRGRCAVTSPLDRLALFKVEGIEPDG
jgi:site-specific recombinase XerD